MKKTKKLLLLICIMFLVTIKVSALTNDEIEKLDSDNKIAIPTIIRSTGSEISIFKTTDYKLYYQWYEISPDLYNNLNSLYTDMKKTNEEATEYVNNNKPDSSNKDEINKYNDKIKEYQNKISEKLNEYYTLLPSFKDEWLLADSENKVFPPKKFFSDTRPFVLYVKLEDNGDNTISYDYGVLKLEGEKSENKIDETVEDVDKNEETVTEKTTEKNTIANPKTVDTNIYIIIFLIIVLSATIHISIKKVKQKKF